VATPPLFAHRLGRAYGPDSSAAALEGALRAGADGLETDVCLTADDELVLLHDPRLEMGTTLKGWVHEHTAAEILRARIRDRESEPTDSRPLLLEQLLASIPADLPVQVEVKAHADPPLARRTAERFCDRLAHLPEPGRIELISFHSAACAAAAARGLRTRLVIWADYAPEALAAWAVSHGVTGVAVEHFLLTERLMAILRLAGLSVTTGTINNAELLRRVAEIAAPDAVCTDRPGELRREAARRQHGAPRRLRLQLPLR
jgi:glycerophosphoryl diester phosphodiesterase